MHVDRALSKLARRHPPGQSLRTIAKLGTPAVATTEGLVAALLLGKDGRRALPIALSAPLALLGGRFLKKLSSRPRPGLWRFRRKGYQSFPSTHCATSAALLTCVWQASPPTRVWRLALGAYGAIALLIATERIRAGAHWPSDVVVGSSLGAVIGLALGKIARPMPR